MQPKPTAETSRPLFPNFLVFMMYNFLSVIY
jgi:hypothetical protein